MPWVCAAYECTNRSNSPYALKNNLSFHTFPLKSPKLLEMWLLKVRRKNFTPTIYSRLCSEHFNADCFFSTTNKRKVLKEGAYPTKFVFSKDESEPKRGAPYLLKCKVVEEVVEESTQEGRDVSTQTDPDVVSTTILQQNTKLQEELELLRQELQKRTFLVENLDEKTLKYVTGFTLDTFQTIFKFLLLDNCLPKFGALSPKNQFFLLLVYLRTGMSQFFLSHLFQISQASISRICFTVADIVYAKLKSVDFWPSRSQIVRKSFSPAFYEKYPNCRIILNCAEFPIQKPSCPEMRQSTFSYLKNTYTLKALVGITPSGSLSFISDLWGGSISDDGLFIRSGLLSLLEPGDLVLADRGFTIAEELQKINCNLAIPNFALNKIQFTSNEVTENENVSHQFNVDRAICKIKAYKYFEGQIALKSSEVLTFGKSKSMTFVMFSKTKLYKYLCGAFDVGFNKGDSRGTLKTKAHFFPFEFISGFLLAIYAYHIIIFQIYVYCIILCLTYYKYSIFVHLQKTTR